MTKQIELTQEQKSLIWKTKLIHTKATEVEAQAFMEVCEEYGLNPLLGDITFQKFETKYGPRVSYLISRDAYLKYAMRQDDFNSMLSGVVKEGDHFELDVVEGVPIHKFGPKRGQIVGAWAVVKTESRGNTLVFADFQEYFKALSDKNSVWKSMPSAMIEKVAQSTALRRTFPLGVIFSSDDELVTTTEEANTESETPTESQQSSVVNELEQVRDQKEKKDRKSSKQGTAKPEKVAKDEKVTPPVQEEQPKAEEPVQPNVEEQKPVEGVTTTVQEEIQEQKAVEEPKQEEAQVQEDSNATQPSDFELTADNAFVFIGGKMRKAKSGTFLEVTAKQGDEQKQLFIKSPDLIAAFDEFEEGVKFEAETEELHGFEFILTAKAV